jgi:hypothetical protein
MKQAPALFDLGEEVIGPEEIENLIELASAKGNG